MVKISFRNPYTVIIFFVALLILATGVIFKPKKRIRQLSESDIAHSQQVAQRARLTELSKFLGDAADNASPRLLYLKSAPHTAVAWDRGEAVTAPREDDGLRKKPLPAGAPLEAIAIPQEADAVTPPVSSSGTTGAIETGEWVMAVARQGEDDVVFAHGLYQGTAMAECGGFAYRRVNSSAVLSEALEGGGLFTLQGGLLGLVTSCQGVPVVVSTASLHTILQQTVSLEDRVEQTAGFRMAMAPAAPGGEPGEARITLVWRGSAANRAGLEPGDAIVELDGQTVHSIADVEGLAAGAGAKEHELVVRRGKKTMTVTLGPPVAGAGTTIAAGMTLESEPRTNRVAAKAVAEGSPAAMAGVEPGDVIAEIGGVEIKSPAQAAALFETRRAGALLVTLERGAERAEAMISHE